MKPWRQTAASVFAVSAVLFTGPATATPAPPAPPAPVAQGARQGFRAAAQLAADGYRAERRRILLNYRDATRVAHRRLRAALLAASDDAQREAAWRAYAEETAPLRAAAHERMQEARATFRAAVDTARKQFGVAGTPSTYATMR